MEAKYLNLITFGWGGYRACHRTPVLKCVHTNSSERILLDENSGKQLTAGGGQRKHHGHGPG